MKIFKIFYLFSGRVGFEFRFFYVVFNNDRKDGMSVCVCVWKIGLEIFIIS